jgi:hypothetical protein
MRGEAIAENGVIGVAGVTATPALRPKPQQLRQLRPLRLENGNGEKSAKAGVTSPVTAPLADDLYAIEERAALAADCVPACYLDAWGEDAVALGWMPGDLFDVTAGLVWRLVGERVAALRPDHARLADGRTVIRETSASETRTPVRRSEPGLPKEGG